MTETFEADVADEPVQAPIDGAAGQPTPIDITGDGVTDGYTAFTDDGIGYTVLDVNQDGFPDAIQIDGADTGSPDGIVDMTIVHDEAGFHVSALDGDGNTVTTDYTDAEYAAASPDMASIFGVDDIPFPDDAGVPDVDTPSVTDGQIIGDPGAFSIRWFEQGFNGACVPSAVTQVYEMYTGTDISPDAFIQMATELHLWGVDDSLIPSLSPEATATLLDAAGVPATLTTDNTLADLVVELNTGRPVLVTVDSGDIWYGDSTPDGQADHQVIVTGIDPQSGTVYLSDTGSPDGNMEEVPMDTFMNAWAGGENTMVICDQPPDEFSGTGDASDTGEAAAEPSDGAVAEPVDPNPVGADNTAADTAVENTGFTISSLPAPSIGEEVASLITRSGFVMLPIALLVTAAGVVVKKTRK